MVKKKDRYPTEQPAQQQEEQPGLESRMSPRPMTGEQRDPSKPRLLDKVAIITGGDSGIGRAVAVAFAKEGADVAVLYLEEQRDARETLELIDQEGRRGVALAGDIGDRAHCRESVDRIADMLGRVDILVNNAAEQHPVDDFMDLDMALMERTFRTNIFSYFYMTQAALRHMGKGGNGGDGGEGGCIINSTSVTAYRGNPQLVDYSATKGAIVAFTRSLALNLVDKGIRVNAVAPGPVWTPLIPATFPPEKVAEFGKSVPMKRAGQPEEIAPCYVFLASSDASFMTGQVLHPNGGDMVGS